LKLLESPDLEQFITSPNNRQFIRKEMLFRIIELANIAITDAEKRG
jgi:hypothetical protein